MGYKHAATGTTDVQLVTTSVKLTGYSIFESAGVAAAAAAVLRQGTSVAGEPIVAVELAANGSETRDLPGVLVGGGVFLDRTAGETTVTIYFE